MEAVGSRLGRASSRYGAPAVFSGPVRKWKKKWVHVSPSLHNKNNNTNNNNSHSHHNKNNDSVSSRLILRRWTPITAAAAAEDDDLGNVSDEPPRRKFRYTPIAVLEEQKKVAIEKAECEPVAENEQLLAGKTNPTHELHAELNMNEISEESKLVLQDSNIGQLDLGLSYPGINGENSQNGDDDQLENKYLVGDP